MSRHFILFFVCIYAISSVVSAGNHKTHTDDDNENCDQTLDCHRHATTWTPYFLPQMPCINKCESLGLEQACCVKTEKHSDEVECICCNKAAVCSMDMTYADISCDDCVTKDGMQISTCAK